MADTPIPHLSFQTPPAVLTAGCRSFLHLMAMQDVPVLHGHFCTPSRRSLRANAPAFTAKPLLRGGCVKMQILTHTRRCVRMVKMQGAEDEGAGSVLKYMTKPEDDSNAADWPL